MTLRLGASVHSAAAAMPEVVLSAMADRVPTDAIRVARVAPPVTATGPCVATVIARIGAVSVRFVVTGIVRSVTTATVPSVVTGTAPFVVTGIVRSATTVTVPSVATATGPCVATVIARTGAVSVRFVVTGIVRSATTVTVPSVVTGTAPFVVTVTVRSATTVTVPSVVTGTAPFVVTVTVRSATTVTDLLVERGIVRSVGTATVPCDGMETVRPGAMAIPGDSPGRIGARVVTVARGPEHRDGTTVKTRGPRVRPRIDASAAPRFPRTSPHSTSRGQLVTS